jgi:hypothetical protein
MAMLIDLQEGETPEELSSAIRMARGRLALSNLRADSRRRGLDSMSYEQIETEIRAARKARKQSNANRGL